jgi:hypothetical protein
MPSGLITRTDRGLLAKYAKASPWRAYYFTLSLMASEDGGAADRKAVPFKRIPHARLIEDFVEDRVVAIDDRRWRIGRGEYATSPIDMEVGYTKFGESRYLRRPRRSQPPLCASVRHTIID